MKTTLFLATILTLFSANLYAANFNVTGISVSRDCSTVDLEINSQVPMTYTVVPVMYDHQPDYWLYEIRAEFSAATYVCPETTGCFQKVVFTYNLKGTKGVAIPSSDGGDLVNFPTLWNSCKASY